MREKIRELRAQCELWLRVHCSQMTPERRLITVLIIGVIFTVVNIYITIKAIYEIGREDAHKDVIEVKHIALPDISASDTTRHGNNLIPENYDNN